MQMRVTQQVHQAYQSSRRSESWRFFQVDHPNQPTVWLEIEKGEEKWGSEMNAFLKFFSEALLVLPAGNTSDLLMIKLSWILIFSS